MIRRRCCSFAAAATKHIQNALHHFSTASSPSAPPVEKCPPKKPTKVALQPKRPRSSTPLSAFADSRSSRFAGAAALRAAQDPNQQKLEELKKLRKQKIKERKKKRETPLFEGLTAAKPTHSELPFAFRFSYTEVPKLKPIGFQAKYSPFGPGRLDRPWDGQEASPLDAPAPEKKESEKKKRRVIDSFNPSSKKGIKPITEPGPFLPGTGPKRATTREEILGEPLTKQETDMLLQHSRKIKKQLNFGRDGMTHNLLICLFDYWTRERVVRIKCMGVSTVDMDNMVFQIEDKTGGKVISRAGGTLHVFRGRYYNNKDRPNIPRMLWRPHSPIYPKLVTDKPGDLKLSEANALRKRGREILPLCRLAKNGYYGDLVQNIREAFQEDDLVRIDCTGVNRPDYKKIGAKLRDLVPCVLISFQNDQILIWKGRERRKRKQKVPEIEAGSIPPSDGNAAENVVVAHAIQEAVCKKIGAEGEDGQDDVRHEDTVELSGVYDDDDDGCEATEHFSTDVDDDDDGCEAMGRFSTDVDDGCESTERFSTAVKMQFGATEDDSVEDDPCNSDADDGDSCISDASCEDEALNGKNMDEKVELIER